MGYLKSLLFLSAVDAAQSTSGLLFQSFLVFTVHFMYDIHIVVHGKSINVCRFTSYNVHYNVKTTVGPITLWNMQVD